MTSRPVPNSKKQGACAWLGLPGLELAVRKATSKAASLKALWAASRSDAFVLDISLANAAAATWDCIEGHCWNRWSRSFLAFGMQWLWLGVRAESLCLIADDGLGVSITTHHNSYSFEFFMIQWHFAVVSITQVHHTCTSVHHTCVSVQQGSQTKPGCHHSGAFCSVLSWQFVLSAVFCLCLWSLHLRSTASHKFILHPMIGRSRPMPTWVADKDACGTGARNRDDMFVGQRRKTMAANSCDKHRPNTRILHKQPLRYVSGSLFLVASCS